MKIVVKMINVRNALIAHAVKKCLILSLMKELLKMNAQNVMIKEVFLIFIYLLIFLIKIVNIFDNVSAARISSEINETENDF